MRLVKNFKIQDIASEQIMHELLALDDQQLLLYTESGRLRERLKREYEAEWLRRMYGVQYPKRK